MESPGRQRAVLSPSVPDAFSTVLSTTCRALDPSRALRPPAGPRRPDGRPRPGRAGRVALVFP